MEYRKMSMFMLRALIGVSLILLIWKPIVNIAFAFAQGPDPRFDLGASYELWYRPPWGSSGGIVYWPSEEEPPEHIIGQPILEFALSGPWIIGKTEKGWFAINKESHDVHYPQSEEQVRTATAINVSSAKMETDPMPYLMVRPEALAAKRRATLLCWILLLVVPTALAFGPLGLRKIAKRL